MWKLDWIIVLNICVDVNRPFKWAQWLEKIHHQREVFHQNIQLWHSDLKLRTFKKMKHTHVRIINLTLRFITYIYNIATFFTNKTKTISDQFLTPQTNNNFITTNTQSLTSFSPLSETEVSKLILSNHPTTCPLDPIPTHLLQAISSSVIPAFTHIINTSLHTGTFPTAFKQARVSPLLKKPALNPALLENYRPVSLLPFIAKTLEWVVFCFLHRTTFWTTTNLASEVATQLRLPYSRLQRPWDWQEQLPNPLYSSCWICLLPLTQLTTRSSCPSSERWASQELPSCGSSLTSQIGPSGCLGGVRFQSHNFLLLEFLKAQCLDHFSSPSTCRH